MKGWIGIWAILFVVFPGSGSAIAEEWSLAGHYAEACSCDAGCPCVYGSSATMGHCHAALAFNITQGNYGKTDLSGLTFVSTMEMGKGTWAAYYLDDKSTPEQRRALEVIFKGLLGQFIKEDLGVKAVPIAFTSDDKIRSVEIPNVLRFSVEKSVGLDGENPILIANPQRHLLPMLVVARSTEDEFKDHGKNWSYKDKSGFHGEFMLSSALLESMKKGNKQ